METLKVIENGRVKTLAEVEKDHIARTFNLCLGDKTRTSSVLGISRATLYRKLKEYSIKFVKPYEI